MRATPFQRRRTKKKTNTKLRTNIVEMCMECVKLGYMQVYHAITAQTYESNLLSQHNQVGCTRASDAMRNIS